MSKDDDKARKAILARRARFMAAALAATGCDEKPQPCLSVSPVQRFLPDGGWSNAQPTTPEKPPDAPTRPPEPPRPCLSPVPQEALDESGQPRACLRLAAPRRPQPCLSIVAPPPGASDDEYPPPPPPPQTPVKPPGKK